MKKLTVGLVLVSLLSVPALAQRRGGAAAPPSAEEMQKKRDAAEVDRQYKDALSRTKSESAPARVDPWANMRGTGDTKTTTKR